MLRVVCKVGQAAVAAVVAVAVTTTMEQRQSVYLQHVAVVQCVTQCEWKAETIARVFFREVPGFLCVYFLSYIV